MEPLVGEVPRHRLDLACGTLADQELVCEDLLRDLNRVCLFSNRQFFCCLSGEIEGLECAFRCFNGVDSPLLRLLRDTQKAFLDKVEVFLDIARNCLLFEPVENLGGIEDLKRFVALLVLVQELDHRGVVVELDEAEHVVGAKLRHMDLANV